MLSANTRDTSLADFMLPEITLGAFDEQAREQEELERNIRQFESILRDDLGSDHGDR